MLLPALSSPLQPPLRHPTEPGGLTLTASALSILRRPGLESHVFLPGVGWVGGFSLSNAIMEDGTQPASVDNPVGYMGDPVATLGAELVTNGDFSNGTTGWTAGSGWSIGSGVASAAGVTADGLRDSPSAYVTGRVYQVSFDKTGTAAMNVYIRTSAVTTIPAGTTGRVSVVIVAGAGATRGVEFYVSSAVATTIDNISVRELVGAIPARQATTANKPILRRGAVNRLFFSQDQSNANWGKSNTTVTAGATAPDATSTAYTLNEDTATSTHDLTQARTITTGLAHTFSVYLKANGRTLARVMVTWNGVADRVHADFNLSNGTVGSAVITGTGVSTATPTITAIGDGWYRCTISGSCATGATLTGYVRAMQSAGVVSYTGSGAAAYNVWGAQLETGSTASPYIPTTTAPASSPTGPYWMEFDGTDFLSLAAVPFQQADDHCVVAGVSPQADPSNTLFAIRSSSSTTPIVAQLRVLNVSGNTRVQALWIDDAAVSATPTASNLLALGSRFVVSARKASNTRQVRVNAGAWTSVTSALGAATVNTATLGASVSTTTGGQWVGAIYPVIVVKGTVTDAELATLERWVASLSGVTL